MNYDLSEIFSSKASDTRSIGSDILSLGIQPCITILSLSTVDKLRGVAQTGF